MKKHIFLNLNIFLFIISFSSSIFATTSVHVPIEKMIQESPVIIRAKVNTQEVKWNKEKTRVLTLTHITLLDSYRGIYKKNTPLTIYQVGGTIDSFTTHIVGASKFHIGEEIVFFAIPFKNMLISYGMGIGKYVIDNTSKTPTIKAEYGNLSWVAYDKNNTIKQAPRPITKNYTLKEFESKIKKVLSKNP